MVWRCVARLQTQHVLLPHFKVLDSRPESRKASNVERPSISFECFARAGRTPPRRTCSAIHGTQQADRRKTQDARRTTHDARRKTREERRTTNDEQRTTSDERRATNDESRKKVEQEKAQVTLQGDPVVIECELSVNASCHGNVGGSSDHLPMFGHHVIDCVVSKLCGGDRFLTFGVGVEKYPQK
jgi:hypothetical protein